MRRRGTVAALFCALLFCSGAVQGQSVDSASIRPLPRFSALPLIGGRAEADERLRQLLGDTATDGFLLRSPSSQLDRGGRPRAALDWGVLLPDLLVTRNSAVPYSQNDGPLWAGRGLSARLTLGVRARYGRVSAIVAPQLSHSENLPYPLLADSVNRLTPRHSEYVAPWYASSPSVDMPLRFGDQAYTVLDPGQSSLTVDLGRMAVGAATENQWWGPGLRNAIVLSDNAGGVPHLFARSRAPIRTRFGDLEARWMVGALTESIFFDTVSTNSLRSMSALALTFRPRVARNLTLGVARSTYRPADGAADVLAGGLDVLTSWERRDSTTDTYFTPRTEQMLSLFGRWVFPESHFEVYTEWARRELPVSLREILMTPNHSQGYTLGFGWAAPNRWGVAQLRGESTYLEYSLTFRNRPFDGFYTSRTIPQGYSQRGQVLGAAIGPGSSSVWLGVTQEGERYVLGVSLARIRWQADALQRSISPNKFREYRSFHAWDASLIGELRAGVRLPGVTIDAEYALEQRYNFLFQNPDAGYGPAGAVDVLNHQLRLRVSPAPRPRRPSR